MAREDFLGVAQRIGENRTQIMSSMECVARGNPYAAEPDNQRRVARLQTKAQLSPREAEIVNASIHAAFDQSNAAAVLAESEAIGEIARPVDGSDRKRVSPSASAPAIAPPLASDMAEKIWGDTVDFANVSFLEIGARTARAVGRVSYLNGRPQGTGFLIGEGLFITNHHVIPTPEFAAQLALDFDYEVDLLGNRRSVTRFQLDPSVFVSSPDTQDGLDYTIIAVGAQILGDLPIETFGRCGLSSASDKHMLGEFANIVQHPDGRYKEVVLRENRLVGRLENALHYIADTEPGSSGSPVFNSEWKVIALHHWGAPWRELFGEDGRMAKKEVNEGIRISAIVKDIRRKLPSLSADLQQRLERMLNAPENAGLYADNDRNAGVRTDANNANSAPRIDPDGRVTWTIPIELSMHLPGLTGSISPTKSQTPAAMPGDGVLPSTRQTASVAETMNAYRDRGGYKRGFIDGHDVALPKLSAMQRANAAKNKAAEAGDDPFELKYHHFSLVMNKERRMAFFTACNIDGENAKSVNRTTKAVTKLTAAGAGLESMADDAEADSWSGDPRIEENEYLGESFYEKQKIAGFPDPRSAGRTARMFQKGHLVRRLDPCWGEDNIALLAELDSFHWTNAAPQIGFFNQGKASADLAGSGGGKLWRAVENYVLRNAVASGMRISSFTGPIFKENDRVYRNIKIPGSFFKVTIWSEGNKLRSLAMIADQSIVTDVWPESLFSGGEALTEGEAFADPQELNQVQDFLSTLALVEKATGLDFGAAVRNADIRKGERAENVSGNPEAITAALHKEPKQKSKKSKPSIR